MNFRDLISDTIFLNVYAGEPPDCNEIADAILVMPEMEAVLRSLRAWWGLDSWCCKECRDEIYDKMNIPQPIREWVGQ